MEYFLMYDEIEDWANKAVEKVGKYRLEFYLLPQELMFNQYQLKSLNWESICYGHDEVKKVPTDICRAPAGALQISSRK